MSTSLIYFTSSNTIVLYYLKSLSKESIFFWESIIFNVSRLFLDFTENSQSCNFPME